ncbi:Uncharacterised protein [Vibrio cholerae]|nr:Uncharacterised protein [Vibrio cholerae]
MAVEFGKSGGHYIGIDCGAFYYFGLRLCTYAF